MNARYILFLLDSKVEEHDGKIFSSHQDAKDYAIKCLDEGYCTQVVIGFFDMQLEHKESIISMVETIGFPRSRKKNVRQLKLFQSLGLT